MEKKFLVIFRIFFPQASFCSITEGDFIVTSIYHQNFIDYLNPAWPQKAIVKIIFLKELCNIYYVSHLYIMIIRSKWYPKHWSLLRTIHYRWLVFPDHQNKQYCFSKRQTWSWKSTPRILIYVSCLSNLLFILITTHSSFSSAQATSDWHSVCSNSTWVFKLSLLFLELGTEPPVCQIRTVARTARYHCCIPSLFIPVF